MKNRFEKTLGSIMISLFLILGSASSAFAGTIPTIFRQEEIDTAIKVGFDYLMTQLNDDGGIRWVDENSSMAASIRVVLAIASAGYTQGYLTSVSGERPIDFITANANSWINNNERENPGFNVARAGQVLTAIAAANENPNQIGSEGLNLIREVKLHYDPSSGVYGTSTPENATDQIWAMIGLAANNASVPEEADAWLTSVQAADGSWNDGFGSYLDTTPLAIMALLSTGRYTVESPPIQSALNFMLEKQQPAGGWQYEWDSATNANTTGVMLQTITLLGQSPIDGIWQKSNGNPGSALLSVQGENGAFGGEFANAYSTADAIVALSGRSITDLGFLEIASNSFDFLFTAQQADGGWGSVGQTLDTLLALQAAGWQPNSVISGQGTPLGYITANLDSYLTSGPDAIGKTILGLLAAEEDPNNFNGIDLVKRLQDTYDPEVGAFGSPENTWHQALAILGLHAANEKIPQEAVETLLGLQKEDGGWEYTIGFGSWPDNTSLSIQALLAAGYSPEGPAIVKAVEYLRTMQTTQGGWGDSSTTAFALMALNALGESGEDWMTNTGKNPISNLMSYQKANGAFFYNQDFTDDNLMATVAALLALFNGDYILEEKSDEVANQAVILVAPGEGPYYADCVAFEDDFISGLELLDRSIFNYSMKEGFINSIIAVGNSEGQTNYWSYWAWDGREWVFKNSSASDSQVSPGTIEAWYFTSWEKFPSLPPTFIPDMGQICSADILRTYKAQPHLDYNDLFDVPMEKIQSSVPIQKESDESARETSIETSNTVTPEISETTSPIESNQTPEPKRGQSPIPLMIISVVGGMVLIIILVTLIKKKKQ